MKRKSVVWDHFVKYRSSDGSIRASCNYCKTDYAADSQKNGTTGLNHHLERCKKNSCRVDDKKQKIMAYYNPATAVGFSKDTCTVQGCCEVLRTPEVEVYTEPDGIETLEDEVGTEPNAIGDPHVVAKEHLEIPAIRIGKLMDFRGFGETERASVPLLEEVCLWHPSLTECQKKRSCMFTECAFTALGRVLHFLKTTKVKDMTEDACERLQLLWEELESFRFDLAWLEPHVQSALSMKQLVERAGGVKKLRADVNALESEMKSLRGRVRVVEVDLETAKRELEKEAEGLDVTSMDSELGYGRH